MCILSMWKVGGVHSTIRQVSTLQKNEVLQQRVPEECVGIPQTLVCCSNTIAPLGRSLIGGAKRGSQNSNSTAAELPRAFTRFSLIIMASYDSEALQRMNTKPLPYLTSQSSNIKSTNQSQTHINQTIAYWAWRFPSFRYLCSSSFF